MNSHEVEERKVEQPAFDIIYQAAIEKNKERLLYALQFACINVRHEEELGSPVNKLAAEGRVDAVDFLLREGASYAEAAFGYARGGHDDEVHALLKRVKTEHPLQLNTVLKKLAQGFALAGNEAELKKLVGNKNFSILSHAALGYAQRGDMPKAKEILQIARDESLQRMILVANQIAAGLILNGAMNVNTFFDEIHEELYKDRHSRGEKEKEALDSLINTIILYYARTGNEGLIPGFVTKLHSMNIIPAKYSYLIAEGLGQVGLLYPDRYATEFNVRGLALGGHKRMAYGVDRTPFFEGGSKRSSYQNKYDSYMGYGFAAGGDSATAYTLFQEVTVKHPTYVQDLLFEIAKGFARNEGTEEALQFIKLMEEGNASPELVIKMLEELAESFSKEGHLTEAYNFWEEAKKKSKPSGLVILHKIAYGLGFSGQTEKIKLFLNKIKIKKDNEEPTEAERYILLTADECHLLLDDIMCGFAKKEHFEKAYEFLEQIAEIFPTQIDPLLTRLLKAQHLNNDSYPDQAAILRLFRKAITAPSDTLQAELDAAKISVNKLIKHGKKFKERTLELKVTHAELSGWLTSGVQTLLLQGLLLNNKKVTSAITNLIVTFLWRVNAVDLPAFSTKLQTMRQKKEGFFYQEENKAIVMHMPELKQEVLTHQMLALFLHNGGTSQEIFNLFKLISQENLHTAVTREEISNVLRIKGSDHRWRLFAGLDEPNKTKTDATIVKIRKYFPGPF